MERAPSSFCPDSANKASTPDRGGAQILSALLYMCIQTWSYNNTHLLPRWDAARVGKTVVSGSARHPHLRRVRPTRGPRPRSLEGGFGRECGQFRMGAPISFPAPT